MRITLIPIGSRGDIQPFVALACQLQRAGHKAHVATHAAFAELVRSHQLDFTPIGGDPEQTLRELGPRMASKNPFQAVPAVLDVLSQLITPTLRGVVQAIAEPTEPSDVIIASYPALFVAIEAAEQRGIPLSLASLHPVTPTEHAHHILIPPSPAWTSPSWRRVYNRCSHIIGDELLFRMVRRAVDAARASELGWGPCREAPIHTVHARRLPILYPLSPTLSPVPPDWPRHTHVTGAWFLEAPPQWQPPPELLAFLAAGPPPLYVGFGSTGPQSLVALRLLQQVLTRRRQRALLCLPEPLGPGPALPEHLLRVGSIPHSWLFPRTAAVLHHGGVGTTLEALRAGVPQGILHFSIEQAFWARAAQRLGVAPPAVAARGLSPAAADALVERLLTERALLASATRVAAMVRLERGVENAAELISGWAHRP